MQLHENERVLSTQQLLANWEFLSRQSPKFKQNERRRIQTFRVVDERTDEERNGDKKKCMCVCAYVQLKWERCAP